VKRKRMVKTKKKGVGCPTNTREVVTPFVYLRTIRGGISKKTGKREEVKNEGGTRREK